jgi:signal transduction histidine kinase
LERNLHNAAEQIRNFKQVAVDQTSEKRRKFDLRKLLDEVLYTLNPQIKHKPIQIQASGPEGIIMNSYPGPLGQVITNCFNNALIHGLEGQEQGSIRFAVDRLDDNWATLEIEDDGVGMPAEDLAKAFDPFFTTKLGQGGSGLGLNLVYNLTTSILGGTINISSVVGQGVKLTFKFPINVPSSQAVRL